jgi:phage baseplate assembly protein W
MEKLNNVTAGIIGSRWGFPLMVSGRGGIAFSSQGDGIEESIHIILSTAKGERRMRPNFGCGIHDLVFAPNNSATWSSIAHHVEEALGWWEPRIEVTDIEVRPDLVDSSRLLINIKYKIGVTNDERNLVYPFYLSR